MIPMPDIDIVTIGTDVVTFMAVDTIYANRGFSNIRSGFTMEKATDGLVLAVAALLAKYLNDWLSTGDSPMITEPSNPAIKNAIPAVLSGLVYASLKKFVLASERPFVSSAIGASLSIYASRNFVGTWTHSLMGTFPKP